MSGQRLEVGRLGAAHGLRGEIAAFLHFAESNVLSEVESVHAVGPKGTRELVVEEVRRHGRGLLVRFAGITDRTAAEALTGARLEVERSELPSLAEGEYYLIDLVGAEVVGPEGPVGQVVAIHAHPSVDSVAIRLRDGRVAEQPLGPPWVSRVDAPARRIELASLDGLIV